MATYTKIQDWATNIHQAGIDVETDQLELSLTNTAYASETPNPTVDNSGANGVLASITPISYTYYTDDLTVDRNLTIATVLHTSSSGTFTLDYGADITITASGGTLASWRYIYIWDDNPTAPVDPLLATWDHGSAISLADTDSATIQFNASGIYTLA